MDAVNAEKAKQVIDDAFTDEITMLSVEPLKVETDLSIVALVGDNMKSHPGISGKMFGAMGREWCEYTCHCTGLFGKKYFRVVSTTDVKKSDQRFA